MDYATLRAEGIRQLERMAGGQWTDFNAHDPGITILEQLCYALTDLGYRAAHPIPDLLAEGGRDPHESLHGPAEILSSCPVTLADLRRLVLDVEGVRNAWIVPLQADALPLYYHPGTRELSLSDQPAPSESVAIQGLHRVLIDAAEGIGSRVRAEVARRLQMSELGEMIGHELIPDLLSLDGPETHTYFTQTLAGPGLGLPAVRPPKDERAVLYRSLSADVDRQRKGRFLSHLLARFGEVIDDHGTSSPEELTRSRQAFLRRAPQLGAARGTAFNVLRPPGEGNRSGLEEGVGVLAPGGREQRALLLLVPCHRAEQDVFDDDGGLFGREPELEPDPPTAEPDFLPLTRTRAALAQAQARAHMPQPSPSG